MTDEQVKKGLECCCAETTINCGKCPFYDNCYESGGTQTQIYKDALALINRLEEENKKLSDKSKELRVLCHKKSNGMRLNDWIRMTQEAKVGIKVVDKQEEINHISKETAKVLIKELEYYSSYENTDLKGGISCLKQYAYEKFGLEVEK